MSQFQIFSAPQRKTFTSTSSYTFGDKQSRTIPEVSSDWVPDVTRPDWETTPPDMGPAPIAPTKPALANFPDVTPKGLKGHLKRALLGMIPGFNEGFAQEEQSNKQEIVRKNADLMKLYAEDQDRYTAEVNNRRMMEQNWQTNQYRQHLMDQRQQIQDEKDQLALRRQAFVEAKKKNDYMQAQQFWDEIQAPRMQKMGISQDEIEKKRQKFMGMSVIDPFQEKLDFIDDQELKLKRDEQLKLIGAYIDPNAGGGSEPATSITTGGGTWGFASNPDGSPNYSKQQWYPNPPTITTRVKGGAVPSAVASANERVAGLGSQENKTQRPAPISAATRTMGETADSLLPEIDRVLGMLSRPGIEDKLGPALGRWNEFKAGKFGSGSDPDFVTLRTAMGLLTTGVMKAHVGASGRVALMQHFEDLANAQKMDVPTLKTAITEYKNWMETYRSKVYGSDQKAAALKTGTKVQVKGRDGYWTITGKDDLGWPIVEPADDVAKKWQEAQRAAKANTAKQ